MRSLLSPKPRLWFVPVFAIGAAVGFVFAGWSAEEVCKAVVELEEVVCTYVPPNNGAGPLWCYGAPLLVRWRDNVFVSASETGQDVPKLCNTRWRVFRRDQKGWQLLQKPETFREREPCPLIVFSDGRLLLSTNPSVTPPGTHYGPCDPHLLEFSTQNGAVTPRPLRPTWQGETAFTDHSYRGIASDARRGEVLLLNIHSRTGEQHWAFLDRNGNWSKQGKIRFPIRACYPQVALQERAAHVLAIGDIVEPNAEWRAYKTQKTGREWDYVFRRLFYTWTPNITQTDFVEPLELENVDSTAGYVRNLDVWLGPRGTAHILYLRKPVQSALLRDRFFPGKKMTTSLEYVALRRGETVRRATLLQGGEGASSEVPGNARFHATEDGKLFVIYYCGGRDRAGKPLSENRILQVLPKGGVKPIPLPLEYPFTTFFTAAERGGSRPSDVIDLFGTGRQPRTLRYARIRLQFRQGKGLAR